MGVEKYGGAGRNGVYNQDVSNNALTIEFGGVDNTMEELYNTSEVFAEIFSEYYWDAQKVSGSN
ncbi:stage II sporulation protein P [Gracilibacillus boraciitolerans JCM 21714]|uniref:Stage II sporulation protein P n=1 Tax=Gracilibacillus boraciitolerans JCM 21714 TaxID=1298598 RepID=W4VEE8_9BACI|nr:stage II sporulation protein P [Gracilibacillus boraciitolerans]GAE91129.1 stage II sporulation protein P [Gracilibacillus boraciitolerans JCM 21714]